MGERKQSMKQEFVEKFIKDNNIVVGSSSELQFYYLKECFKCKGPIDIRKDIHFKRQEGLECKACHIIKVFGSLQAFAKQAGLGSLYQYSKEYIQNSRRSYP